MGRSIAHAAACFLGWLGVVLWLTWPLATRVATELPFTGMASACDALLAAWDLAWTSHALVHHPARIADANIYVPAPNTLFYGSPAFGALTLFAPTYWLSANPTLALNALFLGGIALTATALHLVVRAWTGEGAAGWVAGAMFLSTHWVLWTFVPTAPYFAMLWPLPVIVYLAREPRWGPRHRWLLLGLVALQSATDLVYLAPAAVLPVVAVALGRVLRRATRREALRFLAALAVVLALVAAVHLGFLRTAADNPDLMTQTYWKIDDLERDFFDVPSGFYESKHPLSVAPVFRWTMLVGAVLALAQIRTLRIRERRAWWHCILWIVIGVVASLPILIRTQGLYTMKLPHLVVLHEWFPLLRRIRVPSRLAVAALIGGSLMAGLGAAAAARLVRRLVPGVAGRVVVAAAALAVVGVGWLQYAGVAVTTNPTLPPLVGSYPSRRPILPYPAVDAALAATAGPVLQLPVGRLDGGLFPPYHAAAMYRSIGTFPALLNGYNGHWPAAFPDRMALVRKLPDPEALAALRAETGLALIAVIPPDRPYEGWGESLNPWRRIADQGGRTDLEVVARDGDALLFRVRTIEPAS